MNQYYNFTFPERPTWGLSRGFNSEAGTPEFLMELREALDDYGYLYEEWNQVVVHAGYGGKGRPPQQETIATIKHVGMSLEYEQG